MCFRALMSPPSNNHIDCSCSDEKLKCHCIFHWCAHLSSSSLSSKPSKIYFLHWPWVWLAALEKTVWLPWHSPASLDHIRWKEGNRRLWPSLTLINASECLLDLACSSWTDANLSSPDILGRQADMHRHQTQYNEEKSTVVSISSRDKQQAVLLFPNLAHFPLHGTYCICAALAFHDRHTK